MQLDRRYNRFITSNSRRAWTEFGSRRVGEIEHAGYLKYKLAHGSGFSIVVPDQLFCGPSGDRWIQPLAFGPPLLQKSGDQVRCTFPVDISCGHRVILDFTDHD